MNSSYALKSIGKWLFLILFLSSHFGAAQETLEEETGKEVYQEDRQGSKGSVHGTKGFVPLPLLYYTPDTRLAFGGVGVYYFKLDNGVENEETRLSYTQFLADYTLNRQLDIWGFWNIFFRDEAYISKGEFRYRIYNDRFYGIGNNVPDEALERYRYEYFSIKKLLLKKIKKGMFLGGDYQLTHFYNFEFSEEGQLNQGGIIGTSNGTNSGLGAVFLIDTRDNIVNASKGVFLEISSYFYNKYIGSSYQFVNFNATYNRYFEIKPGHIIATNAILNLNFGDTPFLNLATAGGDAILRGYPAYRFRDMHFTGMQVEYRFPIYGRIGMVLFSGIGEVFKKPGDIALSNLKYSFGGGLRFKINHKENINIRLDYGIGRGEQTPYFMVAEAF